MTWIRLTRRRRLSAQTAIVRDGRYTRLPTNQTPLDDPRAKAGKEWAVVLPLVLVLVGILLSPALYDLLRGLARVAGLR